MLQALPMIAATLALAAPSHAVQTATVYRLGRIEPSCHSDFGDNGFVIQMPKTPAYSANGLLRLVKAPGEGWMRPLKGDSFSTCIIQTQDRR